MTFVRTNLPSLLIVALALASAGCGKFPERPQGISSVSAINDFEVEGPKVQIDASTLYDQGTPVSVDQDAAIDAQGKPLTDSVRLTKGSKLAALIDNSCAALAGGRLSSEIRSTGDHVHPLRHQAYSFELADDKSLADLEAEADADPCLILIGNDIEMQAIATLNDPSFLKQWHHAAMESASGWDTFFGASGNQQDVTVAVVDTGVNYNHPDLAANIWTNSLGKHGRDFVNGDDDPIDDNGHGTHCAGLVGAVGNNGLGVAGVMMSKVKIMAVKGLSRYGSGSTSQLINGMNYAIENGAKVISLSLGGRGTSSLWKSALTNAVNKGVVVVAAAGNDGMMLSDSNWMSPASYGRDLKGVMAIGSISQSLLKSGFSNYSSSFVELGSPGSNIYSTLVNGSYGYMSGTSMATPLVAGTAGLVIGLLNSRGVSATPALVEQLLQDGSVKDANLKSYFKDGNRINLRALVDVINARFPGGGGSQPPAEPTPQATPQATPQPTPQPTPQSTPSQQPSPTPQPTPQAGCGTMSSAACAVFNSVNQQRIAYGVPPLSPLSKCIDLAQSHANDMATNGFFSHTSPTNGTFSQRAAQFGLSGFSGENIAYGYSSAGVVDAWMSSSGHRSNILNSAFRSSGMGLAFNSAGRPYYVQCFSSLVGD